MNPATRQSIIKRYESECGENTCTVVDPEQQKPSIHDQLQGEIQGPGREECSAEVNPLREPIQAANGSNSSKAGTILENGFVIPAFSSSGRNATDRADSGQVYVQGNLTI